MSESALRLPATVQIGGAAALWGQWQPTLRAEAAGVSAQAGREVLVSAADLQTFDTAVLSLLLRARALCAEHGLGLRVQAAPEQLRALATLYGIDEVLSLSA